MRADSGRDEQRFAMLDTVREFAAERAADYSEVAERVHARYFVEYCERSATEAARAHRRDRLERLAIERANIRLAYERLLRGGAADEALRSRSRSHALPWDAHTHEVRGWLAGGLAALTARADAAQGDGALLGRPDGDLAGPLLRVRDAAAGRVGGCPRGRRATLEAAASVALGRARRWSAAGDAKTSATPRWLRRRERRPES